MLLISYYRASFSDFGQTNIQKHFNKNPRKISYINPKVFDKNCEFCQMPKFERSSHCSTCDVCVLRRDHHCPWIRRCVGYQNTQFFINYCLWTWLAGVHYLSGFTNFYNTEYERIKHNPENALNLYLKIFTYLFTLCMASGTFGISMLVISQINSIYNEASYNERRKNENLETYYLCCIPKKLETKMVNIS
jgi:palmitoyltransferase